eukprot:TRINITY_DN38638_c0_g1_i1.p1 TRINITY_DN38638_c0_g1~~TRINITY_DN38638_c0_g1_i1.p1  ORF type:complete len:490 (-),score=117.31 TRINITY_DN38638_c0_g1_i1:119-1561(-)
MDRRSSSMLLQTLSLLALVTAMVDESGRYHAGSPLGEFAPPEPSDSDKAASVDLSKQPVEKLFRLLYYELYREDKRPQDQQFGLEEFQVMTQEFDCPQRLMVISQVTQELADQANTLHLNVTGTSGLYWMLHKHPEEHSWAWLLSSSQDKVVRKVHRHLVQLQAFAVNDKRRCISASFRTVLMNAITTWKRLHGDYSALLWNAVAFGILGDVTSWRELDEDGKAVDEPGGPPPNVSWSENLIFGNMWLSSAAKWLEHHAKEVAAHAYQELMYVQESQKKGLAYAFNSGEEHRVSKDGTFSSFEFLRRQMFNAWSLDKGLLRNFLRYCLRPGYGQTPAVVVGDFGSGGGRYSQWLNDTGLVEAFAFDSAQAVADITGGSVLEVDLASQDIELGRSFDWVLCLDVLSSLPEPKARAMLQNIKRHLLKGGLVLSWGDTELPEKDVIALVQQETGLSFDGDTTAKLRSSCELPGLKTGVVVFRV